MARLKTGSPTFTYVELPNDRKYLAVIREYLRRDNPWSRKTDAIREALRIAAGVILEKHPDLLARDHDLRVAPNA